MMGWFDRRIGLALVPAVVLGMSIASPTAALADSTTPPTVTKMVLQDTTTHTYDPPGGVAMLSSSTGHFTIVGTSYDTNSTYNIKNVFIGIQNADTLQWLQAGGTWSTTHSHFVVTPISSDCGKQTLNGTLTKVCKWSYNIPNQPYKAGTYIASAKTRDDAPTAHVETPPQVTYFGFGTPGTPGPFLTLNFGRTTWAEYMDNLCTKPIGGSLGAEYNLQQIADQMKTINSKYPSLFGVGNVIINRTLTTGQECASGITYPNWSQLATLRSTDGWKYVSAGTVYNNLLAYQSNPSQPIPDAAVSQNPPIPPAPDMQTEICGSASTLAANGYAEGKGEFAYPNNQVSNGTLPDYLQINYTNTCFGWGRRYSPVQQVYDVQVPSGPPSKPKNNNPPASPLWYSRTISINGGKCRYEQSGIPGVPNGSGITCTGGPTTSAAAYQSVPELRNMVETMTPGHWVQFQFYRLVWGSNLSGGKRWDCTSSDWEQHWTSEAELYCYNDFQNVISMIPSGVTIADPLTVATAFGRTTP